MNGRVALVTGASRGVGAAIARSFCERGAKLALLSRTGADLGLEEAIGIACDVRHRDQVFDAVCRKYGIVRCPSLDDLLETSLAFSQGRLPKGNRIAMACYSGGAKGLVLDYASDEGAEMAPLMPETRAKLGTMIDPVMRNSSTTVPSTMMRSASGDPCTSESARSAVLASRPVTQ